MNKKSKIGLYFGSFNPIHSGHLMIASYMVEYSDLKEVWFVISPQNPLKEKTSLLADYHRLALVNVALENDARFRSCDIEFKLPQPSFTINTLIFLQEKYPQKEFSLIMGADNLENLHKWKNYQQILDLYSIYVYPRPGTDGGDLKNHIKVQWVNAPLLEISSSLIRAGLKEKKIMSYFLPDRVYKYILEMHFYEK
jgi:nicotinate-nucleotide adenylyltransferase